MSTFNSAFFIKKSLIILSIPDDREEFQHGNVPKKEVHDLWNEIMESCVNSDLSEYPDFGALADDWNPAKLAAINADDLDATLETPIKQTEESSAVPETNKGRSKVVAAPMASPAASNANISYFDPNAMSTPARVDQTPEQQQSQSRSQSFDSFNSTLLAPPSQPTNHGSTPVNQQYVYQYPTGSTYSFDSNTPILIQTPIPFAGNSNTLNQYLTRASQSNIVKMSSEAVTTSAIPSTVITSFQIDDDSTRMTPRNRQTRSGRKSGHRSKTPRFKNAYKELENLDPNAIQPKVLYPVDERGFTPEQRQILDTQLRKHVQLATQSYVQTYGHPELYTEACHVKPFLVSFTSLARLLNRNSSNLLIFSCHFSSWSSRILLRKNMRNRFTIFSQRSI